MSRLVNTEKVKRAILVISMAALMLSTPVMMPMIYNMGVQFGWWSSNSIANDICFVQSLVGKATLAMRLASSAYMFLLTGMYYSISIIPTPVAWALWAWQAGCL